MTLPTTMRAVQYTEYGASNVLTINQVPVPAPGPGEVLVRVQAFSVNRIDALVRSGQMRLFTGTASWISKLGTLCGGSQGQLRLHPPAPPPNT